MRRAKPPAGDSRTVVVKAVAVLNSLEHVSADGGVVHVTRNWGPSDDLDNGVGKGEACSVDED